jgi:hypothetical protein
VGDHSFTGRVLDFDSALAIVFKEILSCNYFGL